MWTKVSHTYNLKQTCMHDYQIYISFMVWNVTIFLQTKSESKIFIIIIYIILWNQGERRIILYACCLTLSGLCWAKQPSIYTRHAYRIILFSQWKRETEKKRKKKKRKKKEKEKKEKEKRKRKKREREKGRKRAKGKTERDDICSY